MSEARDIELEPVAEPARRARPGGHRRQRSRGDAAAHRGVPHPRLSRSRADPVQQLAGWTATEIRQLIDGAAYLFTNEYEAALTEQKTGWSADEILDRVGTRVDHPGREGCSVIERKGEPTHARSPAPRRRARSTRPASATRFRAGFLAGLAWGLPLERCAAGRHRCSRRTSSRPWAPRSTSCGQQRFLERLGDAYGADAARRRRAVRAVPATLRPRGRRSRSWTAGRAAALGVRLRRSACGTVPATRRSSGVGADLEPGTLLAAYRAGLFPMPVVAPRAGRLVVARPARRAAAGRPAGEPVAAGRLPPVRRSGSTRRTTT